MPSNIRPRTLAVSATVSFFPNWMSLLPRCRRFFKEQGNVSPVELAFPDAGLLFGLELRRQLQQLADLIRGEIEKFEERPSFEINRHKRLPARTRAGEY